MIMVYVRYPSSVAQTTGATKIPDYHTKVLETSLRNLNTTILRFFLGLATRYPREALLIMYLSFSLDYLKKYFLVHSVKFHSSVMRRGNFKYTSVYAFKYVRRSQVDQVHWQLEWMSRYVSLQGVFWSEYIWT